MCRLWARLCYVSSLRRSGTGDLHVETEGEHGKKDAEAEEGGGDEGDEEFAEQGPGGGGAAHLVDEEERGEDEAHQQTPGRVARVQGHAHGGGQRDLHDSTVVGNSELGEIRARR